MLLTKTNCQLIKSEWGVTIVGKVYSFQKNAGVEGRVPLEAGKCSAQFSFQVRRGSM
jgi:hypothetical protein